MDENLLIQGLTKLLHSYDERIAIARAIALILYVENNSQNKGIDICIELEKKFQSKKEKFSIRVEKITENSFIENHVFLGYHTYSTNFYKEIPEKIFKGSKISLSQDINGVYVYFHAKLWKAKIFISDIFFDNTNVKINKIIYCLYYTLNFIVLLQNNAHSLKEEKNKLEEQYKKTINQALQNITQYTHNIQKYIKEAQLALTNQDIKEYFLKIQNNTQTIIKNLQEFTLNESSLQVSKNAPATTIQLTLITDLYPPYILESHHPLGEGIDIEATREIFQLISKNIHITVKYAPWEVCLTYLKKGLADFTVSIAKTPEREPLFLWTHSYAHQKEGYCLVTQIHKQLEQCQKIAVPAGFSIGTLVQELPKHATIVETENLSTAIFGLTHNAFDACLVSYLPALWHIHTHKLQSSLKILPQRFLSMSQEGPRMAFAKHADFVKFIDNINEAIDKFTKEGCYEKIVERYKQKMNMSS